MRLTYDPGINVAYISFKKPRAKVESMCVGDLVVDMSPDGIVYGIEFLNAKEQLAPNGESDLVVVNEATGQEIRLPLQFT
jgi:uncharacterized protein YuzE